MPCNRFTFAGPGKATDAGFAHQDSHQTLFSLELSCRSSARRESGVNPAGTIGLPGRDMDFADQTSEPQTSHLGRRQRPVFVSVIAGAADSEEAAALFGPVASLDEVVDYRVNPFGPGRSSPRSFAAVFKISTSVSCLPDSLLRLG